jgi:hypothetical protein
MKGQTVWEQCLELARMGFKREKICDLAQTAQFVVQTTTRGSNHFLTLEFWVVKNVHWFSSIALLSPPPVR